VANIGKARPYICIITQPLLEKIVYHLTYAIIRLLSILPFWVLYRLSDGLSWLLFYVLKYRRDVIVSNLKIAFPRKDQKWYKTTAREATRHFTDLFLEMTKSLSLTPEEMSRRFQFTNLERLDDYVEQNKDIMVMFAHYASYEWCMVFSHVSAYEGHAVYKPLKNKHFDALIRRIRSKFNSGLIPVKKATAEIRKKMKEDKLYIYGLISDQSPRKDRAKHFTTFFDKPTAVFAGAEILATSSSLPVFYLAIEKVKRGFYSASLHEITPDAKKEEEWHVTDSFFTLLENQIKADPRYYLWTHKRWKASLEDVKHKVSLSPRVHR